MAWAQSCAVRTNLVSLGPADKPKCHLHLGFTGRVDRPARRRALKREAESTTAPHLIGLLTGNAYNGRYDTYQDGEDLH